VQVQHEHGYVYGRLLVERPDGGVWASEEAVQIPPEDLVAIVPYHTELVGAAEVFHLAHEK
jgi:hypothetical protein